MLVTDFRIKYALYKLVLAGFQLFDTGYIHPVRERAVRALRATVDYIDAHMPQAMGFETQKELIAYALNEVETPGYYLEFGVFKGQTLRFMASRYKDKYFHGFDSFEGLPEAWRGFNLGKSAFSLGGRMPRMPSNVSLHKGWFKDSLPNWCGKHEGNVAFIHIDCDIYSSTVDIFQHLGSRLRPGSVILFDEYFNYPNWQNHEYKAWQECVARHRIVYEYLGYARQQVALRILEIN
jgi:hypothetical protein